MEDEASPPARAPRAVLPGDESERAWLTVTSPLLPDFDELAPMLRDVLDRRWVTNQGVYLRRLEQALQSRLGVDALAVVTNGTVALELAYAEALPPGEVICTAFSFPATWNMLFEDGRWTPVMVDIGDDYRIDPDAVAAAITPRTTAIVAVHPYGFVCDHARLSALAERHGLVLLYDAAHCFGVAQDGVPVGMLGDVSTFSFHATKVFNTLEGGAVVGDPGLIARIERRRNFGLEGGDQAGFGTNGKVDEFRAVMGLANLPLVDAAIAARGRVVHAYLDALGALALPGLGLPAAEYRRPGYTPNHGYFPVRVGGGARADRAAVLAALRAAGVLARAYFNPTVATASLFRDRIDQAALPQTRAASAEVLCLPVHHLMTDADVGLVVDVLARVLR